MLCKCVYMCQLHSMVWNDRDLPAQQEAAECGALGDPNRGPDIAVFLLGRKPNAGPISNLVFHQIWQLVSDDKLTEILFPLGNLWHYSCTHTHAHTTRAAKFLLHRLDACNSIENRERCVGCVVVVWLQIQVSRVHKIEKKRKTSLSVI